MICEYRIARSTEESVSTLGNRQVGSFYQAPDVIMPSIMYYGKRLPSLR